MRASLIYLFIFAFHLCSSQSDGSLILYDRTALWELKKELDSNSATEFTQRAFDRLIDRADSALETKNPTVVDKTIIAPSGDTNDYLSISRYWWPDPKEADGLPWIRKDGVTNPQTQTDAVDRKRLGEFTSKVKVLSLAYSFSEDEQFASKAVSMLETWFVNEDTRMNPHLAYAQSVPGVSNGRRSGILDGRLLALVIPDAVSLLRESKSWNATLEMQLQAWFNEYLDWLTESELGISGSKQRNNHGSWYRLQVAVIASFVGRSDMAKSEVEQAMESLTYQLGKSSEQIHEIERTRSFFYSCFNLEPLTLLANLGKRYDIDFWQYRSVEGKSLELALNYLLPILDGDAWEHPSAEGNKALHLISLLNRYSKEFPTKHYQSFLQKAIEKARIDDLSPSELDDLYLLRLTEQLPLNP